MLSLLLLLRVCTVWASREITIALGGLSLLFFVLRPICTWYLGFRESRWSSEAVLRVGEYGVLRSAENWRIGGVVWFVIVVSE